MVASRCPADIRDLRQKKAASSSDSREKTTQTKSIVRRAAPNGGMFDIARFADKRINVQIRSKV